MQPPQPPGFMVPALGFWVTGLWQNWRLSYRKCDFHLVTRMYIQYDE